MASWFDEYCKKTPSSKAMFHRASKVLPSGSARSHGAFTSPYQIYMKEGYGSRIWDFDGNEYVDYNCAGGALILGHAHPSIVDAVIYQIRRGSTLMPSNETEILWAEKIVEHVPCAEMVRATSSGSEACEYAIRLAKLYTNRRKVVKFEGSYHGHLMGDHDFSRSPSVELRGSYERPNPVPESADLRYLPCVQDNTIAIPFNNEEIVEEVLDKEGRDIAAVIVEPVLRANIPARREFIQKVRRLTREHGVLLIFDEVASGFRMGLKGGQGYYDVTADIVALGKALGGGLPIGAFASRKEIMELLLANRRDGRWIRHQGTHGGNPLTTAASLATIKELEKPGVYDRLNQAGENIRKMFSDATEDNCVPAVATGVSSMWGVYFTDREVYDYRSAAGTDLNKLRDFQMELTIRGILPIVGSTRNSLSVVHTSEDLEKTKNAFYDSLRSMRSKY